MKIIYPLFVVMVITSSSSSFNKDNNDDNIILMARYYQAQMFEITVESFCTIGIQVNRMEPLYYGHL